MGLVPSRPGLRPADVLTGVSGLSARLVALDVGICSPAAAGAGADCTETMRTRKLARIAPYERELETGGVDYRPITFSCFGRPHPDSMRVIQSFARRLARRRGTEAHVEERRLSARLGLEIWRRAARMIRQCLPGSPEEAAEEGQPAVEQAVLLRVGHPGTVEQESF